MIKNGIQMIRKYLNFIAIIGLGFLWMGTAYMIQVYRLLVMTLDGGTVNLLVCGAYYVCQAAGIGAVGLLFVKRSSFAGGRLFPFISTIIALICIAVTHSAVSVHGLFHFRWIKNFCGIAAASMP